MRSIDEIKESMTNTFMRNETAAAAYGFTVGEPFYTHFSKLSVESILFFIVATSQWLLEKLFDGHKAEINAAIEEIKPHRPKWYRDKMLKFMANRPLPAESDDFDTAGMTEDEIEKAQVIRHAVATETPDASILIIKIAGEKNGERCPLDEQTEEQIRHYIARIKDAGVRINLVNREPDVFDCEVDIYYDAMLLPENVREACREAIKKYIENLPFNGEYTNMTLIDRLQAVEGVVVPELKRSSCSAHGEEGETDINARHVPQAGYFKTGNVVLTMIAYE